MNFSDIGVFPFLSGIKAAGATQTLTCGRLLKCDTMAVSISSRPGIKYDWKPPKHDWKPLVSVRPIKLLRNEDAISRPESVRLLTAGPSHSSFTTQVFFAHMCTHMLVGLIPFIRPVNPLTASSNPEQALPLIKPTPLPPEDGSPLLWQQRRWPSNPAPVASRVFSTTTAEWGERILLN